VTFYLSVMKYGLSTRARATRAGPGRAAHPAADGPATVGRARPANGGASSDGGVRGESEDGEGMASVHGGGHPPLTALRAKVTRCPDSPARALVSGPAAAKYGPGGGNMRHGLPTWALQSVGIPDT